MISPILVFAINLKTRTDRKVHISEQYKSKSEFEFNIVPAIKHEIGAMGLWQTMRRIVEQAQANNSEEYIVICEDDHLFTEYYDTNRFFDAIKKSNKLHADLLLGGVSHFDDAVEFDSDLFWLSSFTGFQFAVIFRRFYKNFLGLELHSSENIDIKMKEVSDSIFCIYPFISVQKEFGYSDVTEKNEKPGVVEEYFITSEKRLKTLSYLKRHFGKFGSYE